MSETPVTCDLPFFHMGETLLLSFYTLLLRFRLFVLDCLGRVLPRFVLKQLGLWPELTASDVVTQAKTRTSVKSLPVQSLLNDPKWLERLQSVVDESHRHRTDLRLSSRIAHAHALVDSAAHVLKMERLVTSFPQLFARPINRPLVVTGNPRSGTTYLQKLLSVYDETFTYTLPQMQAIDAVNLDDVKTIADFKSSMNRAVAAGQTSTRVAQLAGLTVPNSVYVGDKSTPASCIVAFSHYLHLFSRLTFNAEKCLDVADDYADLCCRAYQYYIRELRLMREVFGPKSDNEGFRHLFKTSLYMQYRKQVRDVFPDLCFIRCIRNPLAVIPSFSSFLFAYRRLNYVSDDVARRGIGECALAIVSDVCREIVKQTRDDESAANYIDVRYENLVSDPVDVCRAIATKFGLRHDKKLERRLEAFVAEQVALKRKKWGKHVYSLEEYGLTAERIRSDLCIRDYCKLFGFELE